VREWGRETGVCFDVLPVVNDIHVSPLLLPLKRSSDTGCRVWCQVRGDSGRLHTSYVDCCRQ
jgi:hypothetical protein